MNNIEKSNSNMEYLKGLYNKLSELNNEYDVIDKNKREYISKYSFKERLENKEVSDTINEFDFNLKDNIKKRDMLMYEKNVIKNNIDLILMDIIKDELLPILKKYEGKRMGEVTKKKIQEEIKKYTLNKYNIYCYLGMYKEYDFTSIKLNFNFYEDNNCVKLSNIEFDTNEYEFINVKYDMENLVPYYHSYDYKYIELESVSDYVSNLYNMRVLTENNIEKLNNEVSKLKSEFNSYCKNNLNDYRI